MIPIGYMAKSDWAVPAVFDSTTLTAIFSVSDCVNTNLLSEDPPEGLNGFGFYDSPEVIYRLAKQRSLSLSRAQLFFYEAFEEEYFEGVWRVFQPLPLVLTDVSTQYEGRLVGFDVVSFETSWSPTHSPLSCAQVKGNISTNGSCLYDTLVDAISEVRDGLFDHGDPGPYRIVAVYMVAWPTP